MKVSGIDGEPVRTISSASPTSACARRKSLEAVARRRVASKQRAAAGSRLALLCGGAGIVITAKLWKPFSIKVALQGLEVADQGPPCRPLFSPMRSLVEVAALPVWFGTRMARVAGSRAARRLRGGGVVGGRSLPSSAYLQSCTPSTPPRRHQQHAVRRGPRVPHSFLTHHVASISTAIQAADAQTILNGASKQALHASLTCLLACNAASSRMLRVSYGVM